MWWALFVLAICLTVLVTAWLTPDRLRSRLKPEVASKIFEATQERVLSGILQAELVKIDKEIDTLPPNFRQAAIKVGVPGRVLAYCCFALFGDNDNSGRYAVMYSLDLPTSTYLALYAESGLGLTRMKRVIKQEFLQAAEINIKQVAPVIMKRNLMPYAQQLPY